MTKTTNQRVAETLVETLVPLGVPPLYQSYMYRQAEWCILNDFKMCSSKKGSLVGTLSFVDEKMSWSDIIK